MSKKLIISLLSFVLLCALASWLAFGERGFIYVYKKDKERQEYLKKIEELKKENQKLMEEIERLSNDSDYIEKVARKELNMVRDGEVIYRFANEKEDKEASKKSPGSQIK
jgi:cell division protein DivIC